MSEINTGDLYTIKTKGFASSHVLNKNFESISESHNELEGRMRNIETGEPVSDAEIQTARGTYATLNEKLSATGKAMKENIVIQGMNITGLTYPSDGRVSFTIKTGEVLIEGKTIKVAQDTAFTEIVLDQNYRVVVCDASGVISVLAQDGGNFHYPIIGQNKRPLYIFKKETDHRAIFYDCRRWGVMSMIGWHFTLQEAYDDFVANYLEDFHALGVRHLSMEYEGISNFLEMTGHFSEYYRNRDYLIGRFSKWTLHLKGKNGAIFLLEGLRGIASGLDTEIFGKTLFENFSIQIAPWYSSPVDFGRIIYPNALIKNCQFDFKTNNSGISDVVFFYSRDVTYVNTNIDVPDSFFKSTHFQEYMDVCQADSLSINGHLLSSESLNLVKDTSSTATHSKKYMLFQYEIPNFDFYPLNYTYIPDPDRSGVEIRVFETREFSLFDVSSDHNRLISSDFVLQSAMMSGTGIERDIDISLTGYFFFIAGMYVFSRFDHRNVVGSYTNVNLKLTFKVYTWYRFLADYSS